MPVMMVCVPSASGASDHPAQQNWAVARVPHDAWEAKRNDRALLAELTESIGGKREPID